MGTSAWPGSSLLPVMRQTVVCRTPLAAMARAAAHRCGAPGLSVWLCVRRRLERGRTRVLNSSVDRSSRVRSGPDRRAQVSRTAEEPVPASTAVPTGEPAVPCAREVPADLSSAGLPTGTAVPERRAADPQLFSEPAASARPSGGVRVLSPGVVRQAASRVPAVSGVWPWRADWAPEGLRAGMAAFERNAGDPRSFREPTQERWPAAAWALLPGVAKPFSSVARSRVPGVQWHPSCVPEAGRGGRTTGPALDVAGSRRRLWSARLRGFAREVPRGYSGPPQAMS